MPNSTYRIDIAVNTLEVVDLASFSNLVIDSIAEMPGVKSVNVSQVTVEELEAERVDP